MGTRYSALFSKIRRPSLRQGLMWGLLLGVVEILYGLLTSFIDLGTLTTTVALALFLFFGFIAGRQAAQETGKLGTGAMAGFWTGLFGSLLYELAYFIQVLVFLPQYVNAGRTSLPAGTNPDTITPSVVLIVIGINLIISMVLYILIALLGGATGGMLGRRRALASTQSQEYEEAMFVPPASKKTVESTGTAEADE